MITIRGKISGLDQTMSAISQLPSLLQQAGIGGMTETLTLFSKTVREKFLKGPYPQEIERRTGSFAATFSRGNTENIFTVEARGSMVVATFGSQDIRARVLNEGTGYLPGGVIKSKRPGGYLAIPTDAARTSPRGPLKAQYRNRSWRDVPNTFVGRSRRGGLFIAQRSIGSGRRRGSGFVVLAILVKEVRIAGRHFMEKTLAVVQPLIPGIFQTRFDRIIQRANETIAKIRRAA